MAEAVKAQDADPLAADHPKVERRAMHADMSIAMRRAKQVLRKTALANGSQVIERDILRSVVIEEGRRWSGCLMLPVTICFFAFYSAAASLHEDIGAGHLLDRPLREKLEPLLDNVLDISDMWNFVLKGYLPFFFQQTDDSGRPLPQQQWGTIYKYGQVKGGVVMEMQRSTKVQCSDSLSEHTWCYPQDSLSTDSFGLPISHLPVGKYTLLTGPDPLLRCEEEGFSTSGCSSRRLELLRDELAARMPSEGDNSKSFRFFVSSNVTYDRAAARIQYLINRGWVDEQTTQMVLKVIVLNYQLQIPRLEQVAITFSLSRGGGIFVKFRVESLSQRAFTSTASYVMDTLFVIMLVASTLFVSWDLFKAVNKAEIRKYFSMVNIVMWLTCLMGWLNVVSMIYQETLRTPVNELLAQVSTSNDEETVWDLNNAVDTMVRVLVGLRVFTAYAHLLFMCRSFLSLQWQPRLAVVTQTLAETAVDLFHFLLVLLPTWFAFAISGMMMFGRYLESFATIERAVATCFGIAVQSQWPWMDVSSENYLVAMTWSWTYLLLVVLIMLNMVLAIILDVYTEVSTRSGNTMTVWRQLKYIYSYIKHRKEWVNDATLLAQLPEMPQMISIRELREAFPQMHDVQLNVLLGFCRNRAEMVNRMGIDSHTTAQLVAAIHVSLEAVLAELKELKHSGWMARDLKLQDPDDRDAVKSILTSAAYQTHWAELMNKRLDILERKVDNFDEGKAIKETDSPVNVRGNPGVASDGGSIKAEEVAAWISSDPGS